MFSIYFAKEVVYVELRSNMGQNSICMIVKKFKENSPVVGTLPDLQLSREVMCPIHPESDLDPHSLANGLQQRALSKGCSCNTLVSKQYISKMFLRCPRNTSCDSASDTNLRIYVRGRPAKPSHPQEGLSRRDLCYRR